MPDGFDLIRAEKIIVRHAGLRPRATHSLPGLAACLAAGALLSGCFDTSPGGANSQAQALRAEAYHPACVEPALLLVLDEDAIANGRQCDSQCDNRDHGKDKHHHKDHGRDDDKDRHKDYDGDKDKDKDRDRDRNDRDKDKSWDKDGDKGSALAKFGTGSGDKKGHGGGEEKVTLCHLPPGNPSNAKTLTIGAPAVRAHMDHGDRMGECPEICGGKSDRRDGTGDGANVGACLKSEVGYRGPLDYFVQRQGTEFILPGGSVGDEGWFALKTVRVSWRDAGPDDDGLRNYVEAGPGLGGPDAKGNRETLLDKVPDLTPLRATGLAKLVGKSVCAVVLDGDASIQEYSSPSGSIKGPNLGKVAFQVLGTSTPQAFSSSRLPDVKIRILDANAVCDDELAMFQAAPPPVSACAPMDIVPPACTKNEVLLNETWDAFDPKIWAGDGDGEVADGLFFARQGTNSSVADWIRPCPLRVDSLTSVRFNNRVQFSLPAENDFAEAGALFFVNAGEAGSFDDFVFLNVGYTVRPSKVFVELFGSDGGQSFDQFMETSVAYSPSLLFGVELWIDRDSYRIAVGGVAIDTVDLAKPIEAISLFEVGVQQNSGGLRGLIDQTTITQICAGMAEHNPRPVERSKPRSRCLSRHRVSKKTIHAKADHSQCHHARSSQERYHGNDFGGEGSGKRLAKASAWTKAAPNPCGRNDLIRSAREKVRGLSHPPLGLLLLSQMKEQPGCVD